VEDYQGGRDYDSLLKFAEENLKPMCSPSNLDLCDDDKKAEIEKYQAMGAEALSKEIAAKEEEQATLEKEFQDFVQGLQKQYQEANEEKDAKLEAIKESGLGLMRAVKAAMGSEDEAKKEL